MAAALATIDADERTRIDAVSSLYRTPTWGKTDQPDFLNAVARITTSRSPQELLQLCLDAESSLHRVRTERWGPRTIDIDVLLYGNSFIDEASLTIPHPRMAERAFVMVPLAEIAPDTRIGGKRADELAASLDTGGISGMDGPDWWRR